ncbi:hypothetical protein K431DRAFT_281647 [Polychaeton citri CBS 116435]|uniref:C3H1-type domain-containing protein n=1 Tax=Polychaeton citri CBS 116435 TaxID=1314669 RepID=A0A9P4QCG6_9PEZI|nr:hypothetical protein K431DRAFT_281647 [Polychaeton citri CBS 116435]
MLEDPDIEQTSAQLADFRVTNARQQALLSDILGRYNELVDSYRRLKSDYEEERDARERYKQLARQRERNPFVLVLVDGDGYTFHDDLVSRGSEGGAQAARRLQNAVRQGLHAQNLQGCRIVTRIYCNVAVISKALAKAKLCGPEKRSLAPFVASFNQSETLSDFVDVGDSIGSVKSKVGALLQLYADNPQCKHIFFAGCHDPDYISQLMTFVGQRNRLTLVKTSAYDPQFESLQLPVSSFPEVFEASHFDQAANQVLEAEIHNKAPSSDTSRSVCTFFSKNACKKGNKCKFLHIEGDDLASSQRGSDDRVAVSSPDVNCVKPEQDTAPGVHPTHAVSRGNGQYESPGASQHQTNARKSNSIQNLAPHITSSIASAPSHTKLATILPPSEDIPPGMIAINANDHRLDPHLNPLSSEDLAEYKARISMRKLCNDHHLNGDCSKGRNCPFDHAHLPSNMMNALKTFSMARPCPRRGDCRRYRCQYGHLCQRTDCGKRGGKSKLPCKFSLPMHMQNFECAALVPSEGSQIQSKASISNVASDVNSPRLTQSEEFGPEPPLETDNNLIGQAFVQTNSGTYINW